MNKHDVVQGTLLSSVPAPTGYILIAQGVKIVVYKKPNWFHLLMMRLLLGWTFEEHTSPTRSLLNG
jgi:hypothetical protein